MNTKNHINDNSHSPEKPAKKSHARLFLRLLLYPAITLVVVLLAIFLLLQTGTARSTVKGLIEKTAGQVLDADLRIGRISGSLLFDFSLEAVRLSQKEKTIFSADRISTSYLLPLALTRLLFFNEIEIDGMILNLAKTSRGHWNVATLLRRDAPDSKAESRPFALSAVINRIAIQNAAVTITDAREGAATQHRLNKIRLVSRAKLSPGPVISVKLMDFSFSLDRPELTLNSMTGHIDYEPGKNELALKNLRIRSMDSDMALQGKLDLAPGDIAFDLKTEFMAVSLPAVANLFSTKTPFSGSLRGSLTVTGKPHRFYHEAGLHLAGMSLTSSGHVERNETGALGIDIAATATHLNPAALPFVKPPALGADINCAVKLKASRLNRPDRSAHLAIDFSPSALAGYELTAGSVKASYDPAGLALSDSHLVGPAGKIEIQRLFTNLPAAVQPVRLELQAAVKDIDLAALNVKKGLSGRTGFDLTATAALPLSKTEKMDLSRMSASVSAGVHPSKIQGVDIRSGLLNAEWDGKHVTIRSLELLTGAGRLSVSGALTPEQRRSRFKIDAALPELDRLAPLISGLFPASPPLPDNLKGRLDMSGTLSGWIDRPQLSATVRAADIRYHRIFAENFQMQGRWTGLPDNLDATAGVQIENFRFGTVRLPRADVRLTLSPQKAQADIAMKAEKGLEFESTAGVDGWRQPVKSITIETLKLTNARKVPQGSAGAVIDISNRAPLRITLAKGTVAVTACELVSETAVFSLNGRLSHDGSLNADVSLHHLDLNRVAPLWPGKDPPSGMLAADLRVSGSLAEPVLQTRMSVKNAAGLDFSLSTLDIGLDYSGARAVFSASGHRQNDRIFDLNGAADLLLSLAPFKFQLASDNFSAAVHTRSLKLSALPLPQIPGYDYDGFVTLDASIDGDLKTPVIKAKAAVKDGFVSRSGKAAPFRFSFSDLDLGLDYSGARAAFRAALFRQEHKLLNLDGQTGLDLSLLPFRLKLSGSDFKATVAARDLKLSMLPVLNKAGLDYDGTLNLAANLSGSVLRPSVSGTLSLTDARLSLANPPLSYQKGTAEIDFSPERIGIKQFQLSGEKSGNLSLKGDLALKDLKPAAFNLRLTGENVNIPYRKALYARVQPDLTLAGTPREPELTGALTITEGRVNLDLLSDRGPSEIQIESPASGETAVVGIPDKESGAAEFIRPLVADVVVEAPRNVWLKGQGVNSEIGGRINLRKASGKPFVLIGSLNTLRGTFDFRNKPFKITQGQVDFIGLEEPDPNLDIQAETRIRKVKIIIKISGTAGRMVLTLDSEPAMDRTDIISYLVFGRPADELKDQQSSNAEAAALNLTGQIAANELKNILSDEFGLDVLTLDSSGGDITRSTVAIGKYVTPEVFVLYRHRFKADEPDQVEVTYEINRNFSIESQLGDEQTTGIDLIWDFDF